MAQIIYYTIQRKGDVEDLVRKLTITYGLQTLYSLGEPIKMMGSHRVYNLKCPNRDLTIKIEGPQEAVYDLISKISSKLATGVKK